MGNQKERNFAIRIVIFLLCITGMTRLAQAQGQIFSFSVVADVPYEEDEVAEFQEHINNHNLYSPSDFIVHLGDIFGSDEDECLEYRYIQVADILKSCAVPAFIVPGDNEWNDCEDPVQAWIRWTTHLLAIEENFCGTPSVERQSVRPENFAFIHKGVLFIGINLVGGSVLNQNEWNLRMQQDADWISQHFLNHAAEVRAAVVFGHAGPHSSRDLFFDQFVDAAIIFGKPVLYLQGNGHSWKKDNPWPASNTLRVQLERGTDDNPPVQVTVTLDTLDTFDFERDPWPNGTQPFNRPPCVDAGTDQFIAIGDSAHLIGFVTDDGVPNPPGASVVNWSQVSGPGNIVFSRPDSLETYVHFSEVGLYQISLTANDGELASSDTITVQMEAFSIAGGDVIEGNFGTVEAVFQISLLDSINQEMTVRYYTGNGSAVDSVDYQPVSGFLTFSDSITSQTVTVLVNGDETYEADETFYLNLSDTSDTTIILARGMGRILNDDAPPVPLISSFSPSSGSVTTEVKIFGQYFINVVNVHFNGEPAFDFFVDSETLIRAVVPPQAGSGKISVQTATGVAVSSETFHVTGEPVITSFMPVAGPVDTEVTINGYNFNNVSAVTFHNAVDTTFTVDSENQLRAYIPPGAQSGIISIINNEGVGLSADSFMVIPSPPHLTAIPDTTMNEGDTLTVEVISVDPDLDNVTLMVNNLPGFAVFADSGNGQGVIRFTPAFEDSGTYFDIEIVAADDDFPPLTDTTYFTLTVKNVNRPPVLNPLPVQIMDENSVLEVAVSATDADGDNISLTVNNLPVFGNFVNQGNGTGSIHFTPGFEDAGFYPAISVIAADNGAPSLGDTVVFDLTVNNVNRAPVLTPVANQLMNEGDTLKVSVTALDADGDTLFLSVNNLPPFGNFVDFGDGSGKLHFSPGFTSAGVYSNIRVIAADMGLPALSDTVAFMLTVNGTNRAPQVASVPDQAVAEDSTLNVAVSATDLDGDSISLSVNNLPSFGSFTDNGDGTGDIHFAPGFEDAGIYPGIEVIAVDNGNPPLTGTVSFALAVHNTNRPPEITAIADQEMNEGDTLAVNILSSDPDGDSLAITVNNFPDFGSFTDNGDGTAFIIFTPGFNKAGTYPGIMAIVVDSNTPALSDTAEFTLTVHNTNLAPLAVNDADSTAEDIGVKIEILTNDIDPDGDKLHIHSLILIETTGSVTIDPGDTTVTYAPAPDSNGVDIFHYVVSDEVGALDTARVMVFIQAVNDPPVFGRLPDTLFFAANAADTLHIWGAVHDIETPDSLLSFGFLAIPDTLSFTYITETGILVITAKNHSYGAAAQLIITAEDPEGGSTSDTLRVIVEAVVGINPFSDIIPLEYVLMQNFPNPFNPATKIRFGLPEAGKVKIEVINILGQRVATLLDEYKTAGYYVVNFDARYLASGVYFYLINAGNFRAVRKMILLR